LKKDFSAKFERLLPAGFGLPLEITGDMGFSMQMVALDPLIG
jgi:hypothetical protein